jgi:hypothetical protein
MNACRNRDELALAQGRAVDGKCCFGISCSVVADVARNVISAAEV